MKPYNITAESIKMGEFAITFSITGITLGERGRGRICTIVPTPDQYEYLELGVSKSGRPRLNKSTSSEGWIARIETKGSYVRGATGRVYASPDSLDSIKVVARGQGAYEAAGRIGTWQDLLIAVPDGAWVRVKPCRQNAYILYFSADKVSQLSYEEAEALDIFDLKGSSSTDKGDLIVL
jgi:hypothetical protein